MKDKIKSLLEKYNLQDNVNLYNDLLNLFNGNKLNLNSLTTTERQACKMLVKKFNEDEFTVIVSRFADECGITRSVIVNALKKLEAAAAIKTTSLGMRGTYIQILDKEVRRILCEEDGN